MNKLLNEILAISNEIIQIYGLLLVDVELKGDQRNRIVEIFIDDPNAGVTAEVCAEISGKLGERIEEAGIIDSKYRLVVSSPGIDRPLKYLQQYKKNLNRKFDISYTLEDQIKKITGKLIEIDGEDLKFQAADQEYIINFNNIKKAQVLISFR